MDYIFTTLGNLVHQTAFFNLTVGNFIMIFVACFFLYLAIGRGYEPLLLVPIAFGMLLVNLYPDIMKTVEEAAADGSTSAGLLHYFFLGDEWGIWPSLIFLGVGAMTDFGPLIANPASFLLGAAAQFGIFFAYIGAMCLGFEDAAAAAISIIGGADGPTSIYLASKLGQAHLMGPIAVAAYSYMSLVPIIQPPIMKALTTKEERSIKMEQLRPVSKLEKIQCHDVYHRYSSWYIRWCHNKCRSIPELDNHQDCSPWPDSLCGGNSIRCPVWQNYVQSNRRQGKSSDWFRGRIRSTDGSPCFSESRCRRGSDKFPADACHGTERCRCYRYSSCCRCIYGYFWCIRIRLLRCICRADMDLAPVFAGRF